MILGFLWNLLWTFIGVMLGAYILFFGRRALWATLGIVGLAVTANLLAVFVAGAESGMDLIALRAWGMLAVVLIAAAGGVILGRYQPTLAVSVIGFAMGATLALWLYDIALHLVTAVARFSEQVAIATLIALIIVIGGLLGLWLVHKARDEALILITMLIGTELIHDSLGLSETSSLTAIFILSLTLAGLLVQYGSYLRELKANTPPSEPVASSVQFFQDLELDN